MAKKVVSHLDLDVYARGYEAAMEIFRLSRAFPKEEQYALTDQIRRSSRSVCANIAEAWRSRRYQQAFINKLSVAEAESAETQVWLQFAVDCGYLAAEDARKLFRTYESIIVTLVGMINHPETWTITKRPPT
ncbi:MAG: four helix bundle protein [Caldilineaceae bacterium]|nr:four helix bundle protein [Caldilineaceae bacterium]